MAHSFFVDLDDMGKGWENEPSFSSIPYGYERRERSARHIQNLER